MSIFKFTPSLFVLKIGVYSLPSRDIRRWSVYLGSCQLIGLGTRSSLSNALWQHEPGSSQAVVLWLQHTPGPPPHVRQPAIRSGQVVDQLCIDVVVVRRRLRRSLVTCGDEVRVNGDRHSDALGEGDHVQAGLAVLEASVGDLDGPVAAA
jgi:hypothetical protein